MANSVTNLDEIQSNQAQKEVTANALFDAASPATVYGRRASTTAGLTWGYYGGNVTKSDGTLEQIANGTLTLTASATNYIVALKSTGAVSFSTASTNWNNRSDYYRLYSVTTNASATTGWTDAREIGAMTKGARIANANQAALTDSTGGTASGTVADVGGTYDQAQLNDNFASVLVLLNQLRSDLIAAGIIKGAA